ncbi:MAG: glycosyltransferase, partial [Thermoplasmata archaeon]|nr:glycosyltransferase [Thermoplasmata archaeon]
MTAPARTVVLDGGVLAVNERHRIVRAIRSLLRQSLPEGVVWGEVHVVVSGSTDGTAETVLQLAETEPRVRPLVEPTRRGKSAALAEVFQRSQGDYLVLLNGDAEAEDGAVAALLSHAGSPDDRFAVMARPVPRPAPPGGFADAVRLLWSVHHAFHATVLATGEGNHLSDELLLLPGRQLPPMEAGIVNDGSFVGGWLSLHDGDLR